MAAAVRRGSRDPGPDGPPERHRLHRHRRDAGRVHRPRSVRPRRVLRAARDVGASPRRSRDPAVRGARFSPAGRQGPPEARRHAGASPRRAHLDRPRPRARVSGHESSAARRGAHRAGGEDRRCAADRAAAGHAGAARVGRPAGRLRQRRRAADEPFTGARARDRAPPGDRRGTAADRASADHRERADRAARRHPGPRRRLRRRRAVPAGADPDRSPDRGLLRPGSARGARQSGGGAVERAALWARAGDSNHPHGSDGGDEGDRRRRVRAAETLGPRGAGRWAGGDRRGPPGGGDRRLSRVPAAARRRAGFPHRPFVDDESLAGPTPLQSGRGEALLRACGGRGAARAGRRVGRVDALHADGRSAAVGHDRPGGLSVPAGQGQRGTLAIARR